MAATAKLIANSDLPVPAGPRIRALEPRSMPPPSRASSSPTPLGRGAGEGGAVFRGDDARIDLQPAGLDGEVVIAAAEPPAAIFDDPHPAALGAVFGGQFLQLDHAVGDAVHGLVVDVGGQVVEHQDRGAVLGEIVLQRQDLAAVAQRALGQQPDLRQAVDHHPLRLGRPPPPRRSSGWSRPARGPRNRAGSAAAVRRAGFRAAPVRRWSTPSSVQPCERAVPRSSSSVSDRVM
jgi:hypothetical protein